LKKESKHLALFSGYTFFVYNGDTLLDVIQKFLLFKEAILMVVDFVLNGFIQETGSA
jgi:hypothetical protein